MEPGPNLVKRMRLKYAASFFLILDKIYPHRFYSYGEDIWYRLQLKKYEMNDFLKCVYSMYYIKHALVYRE